MKELEILYDHYKESNLLSRNAQKDRNTYFKNLCLAILFNLIFLLYPDEIVNAINQVLKNNYSTTISITFIIVQSFTWLLITYLLIQYLHKNIYIERQYPYLASLEKEINELSSLKTFNREGDNYLNQYPLILNVLDVFYKWIIPLLVIIINGIKLYFEYVNNVCLFLKINDTICFSFIALLVILYLKMLHFSHNKNEKKAKNNTTNIKFDININLKSTKN